MALKRATSTAGRSGDCGRRTNRGQRGTVGGRPCNRVAVHCHSPGRGESSSQSAAGPECPCGDSDAGAGDQGTLKFGDCPDAGRTRDLPVDTAGLRVIDEGHCCAVPNRERAPDLEDIDAKPAKGERLPNVEERRRAELIAAWDQGAAIESPGVGAKEGTGRLVRQVVVGGATGGSGPLRNFVARVVN